MMNYIIRTISVIVLASLTLIAHADPPPFSGIVVRGETTFAITWIDAEAGLRVVVGADMDEFCAGVTNFDLLSFQNENLPSGRLVAQANAVMQTTVWDFLAFDCGLFTTIEPVASGYARVRNVDNDLVADTDPDGKNTNTWTWMVHGKLEDPWASTMILSAHLTQQFGNPGGYKFNSQIVLH